MAQHRNRVVPRFSIAPMVRVGADVKKTVAMYFDEMVDAVRQIFSTGRTNGVSAVLAASTDVARYLRGPLDVLYGQCRVLQGRSRDVFG